VKRRHKGEHANHERWLVSYADFITLLFAFFVVMFAASNADHQKAGQIAHAVQSAFKELAVFDPASKTVPLGESKSIGDVSAKPKVVVSEDIPTDMESVKEQLKNSLKSEIEANLIHISEDSRGVTVSLAEAGFFDPGSATVKESALPVLQRIADKLDAISENVRVEGHTDNTPIHTATFRSNWELSTSRATNVLQYLINGHIPPERLSAVGYGEYHPAAPNDTGAGRAANRRVDLVIIGSAAQRLEPATPH